MIGAIFRRVSLVAFTLSGFAIIVYDVEVAPIVPMLLLSGFAMLALFSESPRTGVGTLIVAFTALVALPPVHGFSCKARQSEAKTNLAGLFTSEKAFFSEYGAFSTDLVSIVWFPDGSPLYVYGFAQSGGLLERQGRELIEGYDPSRRHTLDLGMQFDHTGAERYSTRKMYMTDGSPLRPDLLPVRAVMRTSAPHFGFMAAAVGDIDTDDPGVQLDVWTINGQRELKAVANDCAG